MKAYKELAGQTLIYGLGTIIPRVLNFLLTPLYTYTLIESNFGVITFLYSYVAFFMVLLTFGMETTFFRFSSLNKDSSKVYSNAFTSLFLTSSLFIIGVLLLKDKIASSLGYTDYGMLITYLGFILFFDVITAIPLAKLRQDNRAKFFAIIRTVNVLINISLNLFFFVICKDSDNEYLNILYNTDIGVGYAFISNLVASFFTFVVLFPSIIKIKFTLDKKLMYTMLQYALPLVIVGFAGMVNEVADKIILSYLTPNELNPLKQVGIYGANYKLAVLMTIFIQMFKYAAEPFFFKYATNLDAKEVYSKIMTYFVIFCLLIFLMVTLYIDVFKLFIGSSYRVGLQIVPIVLLANMFLGIYYNLSVWYKLNNLTKFGALISLTGVFITVFINILFIPKVGYIASAWATFFCYLFMMIFSYILGQKYYKINYSIKRISLYIFSAIGLFYIKRILTFNSFTDYIISSLLFFVFILLVIIIEKISVKNLKSVFEK